VADARGPGAQVVTGGKRHARGELLLRAHGAGGRDARMMACAREETFGPVAPLFRFDTEDEVVRHGQRHRVRSGRATSTARDIGRSASASAEALEYGMVGVNTGLSCPPPRRLSAG
jgi:succinate-semialdehyde dehydrogenase/glutarate-semialdehyde dehydrogenase